MEWQEWQWIPPTVVALLAVVQAWRARHDVKKLHVEVNSRLTELLVTTEAVGHARGIENERDRQEKRND